MNKKTRSMSAVAISAIMLLSACDNATSSIDKETGSQSSSEETTMTTTTAPEFETAPLKSGYTEIKIDGDTANKNPAAAYRGLGMVTGNNSSRLLMDYKEENPESYQKILEYLFKKDCGAGLTHIKIEFGTDVNSSSGTEPSTKRSEDEKANVNRGAGFMLAADALKINPDITIDLLRWGEPKWVTDAFSVSQENGFEARYKWYIETINAAYDEFGIKFSYISADGNEPEKIDTDWIIYFANRLHAEENPRYDFSKIKIVASDEVGTWKIAKEMMNNEALRNAVGVLGEHYNTKANDNVMTLHNEYGKEIWYSEGIASTNIASLSVTSNGSGINGTNGCLDVCNRIINGYYNGRMTMYEYQPAVAAYYSGAKYFPKSIINANTPWNGYYEIDAGVWCSAHFTSFASSGWQFIDSACFGDGEENHAISNTTNNYMTLTDSETGDYSVIICNDSDKARNYTFTVNNLKKAGNPIYIWETVGNADAENYDSNYLRKIAEYKPVDNENGSYSYSVEVKPYSIITITTLDKTSLLTPSEEKCNFENTVLTLPFTDNFDYSEEFVNKRGGTPKYTTDQGGAFEVIDGKLTQIITEDNKPTDWRFRGTPAPITSLGDDRWKNYSVESEINFASGDEDNYIGLGLRYNCSEFGGSAESGYAFILYSDGKYQLNKTGGRQDKGEITDFDSGVLHTIKISAEENVIKAYVDGSEVISFTDNKYVINSGRISLSSGYYNNTFDNLKAEPIGESYYVTRIDDHDKSIAYSGEWDREVPKGYTEYNRTLSVANIKEGDAPATLKFKCTGTQITLIGPSFKASFEMIVDGEKITVTDAGGNSRCSFYISEKLENKEHEVEITVTSGKFALDAVEVNI